MRWSDFDTSTEADRERVRKEREPKAWAVLDKIGAVCHLSYDEESASQWRLNADAEHRNRNMSGPGYTVVPLFTKRP
jgi:hypothetical protein